jgi:hypothetical protein
MLYDQAQLALAYLEAGQATGETSFLDVAEDTLSYVHRDMTDSAGGFYSAEDADSIPPESADDPEAHKTEGAFYVWTDDEVKALVGDDIEIARRRFGLEEAGNAPHDPHGEFHGKNLLYVSESVHDIAARTGRSEAEVQAAIERVREQLYRERSERPRPHLDDKVLTSWNGLMIAAFARAGRVLADRDSAASFLAAARRAAEFIRRIMWKAETGELLHRYREGDAAIAGYAEDYAFLAFGLLELFQADGDVAWLQWAQDLQRAQDERFWDEQDGGWFSTTGSDPSVLLRLKEDYDGAEPSASAVSVMNLLTLTHLMPSGRWQEQIERTLGRLGANAAARAVPMLLCGLSAWHAGLSQIVVLGERGGQGTRALERELASRYLPFAVHVPVAPPAQAAVASHLAFIEAMHAGEGAAAYVCRDFTCQQPVSDPAALATLLDGTPR